MSDFTVTQALTPEELKQYNDIIDELQRIDFGIAQGITNKSLDDDTIAGLNEKRRQLEDKLTRYRNLSLSRLSKDKDKDIDYDFEEKFSDIILDEPSSERGYSQKMAAAAADFYCKQYPDNPVYQYIEGETLTEYVDRLVAYLASTDEDTEVIKAKRAELIEYPLDKVNSRIWNLLEKSPDGQIGLFVGQKKGKEAVVTYSINFDDLSDVSISKKLTSFDKRVYIAMAALVKAGNNVVSLTQVAYAMGYISTPSDDILKRIYDSIIKMNTARIQIDNQREIEVYKNYVKFDYKGALLPLEIVTATINGKLTDAAIRIFREPPLVTYAKQHKQITTVKVGLLQSPLRKTESNLCLEDYIIEQISHMKKGKIAKRMLLDTIYTNVGITDKKQRQRTPPKIVELLQYYKKQNWIKGYSIDKTGVDIVL